MLALHVEGDLPDAAAVTTARHLASCERCRRFVEELEASQALLKSARRATINLSDCAVIRREVMQDINSALGWRLRLERAVALGLRPSYGMAAIVLLGMLSVTVLAQMRPATHQGFPPAVDLSRPEGYQQWILVTAATAADEPGAPAGAPKGAPYTPNTSAWRSGGRVYINPSSYHEYVETGAFPDGTMLVWEAPAPERRLVREGPHATSATLLVSLRDSSKFQNGWGFFDFSGSAQGRPAKARALPASRGCLTCHRQGPAFLQVGWSRAILTS
jgi:hypothetical protein